MMTITGKCMGIFNDEFKNKDTGEISVTKKLGIGFKKERGYEDELDSFDVTLAKDIPIDQQKRLEAMKGKMVNVVLNPRKYINKQGKPAWSYGWAGIINEVGASNVQKVA